jgi:hypothetical protein
VQLSRLSARSNKVTHSKERDIVRRVIKCDKEAKNKYLCLLVQKAPERLAYYTRLRVVTIMDTQNISKDKPNDKKGIPEMKR